MRISPPQKPVEVGNTTYETHGIGVAKQIGKYSDVEEVASNLRWLMTEVEVIAAKA